MKRLSQKVAIVTGGAQGIGKGIVEKFAKEGATVIIWDVQKVKAHTIAVTLKAQGLKVAFMEGIDVTNFEAVKQGMETVAKDFGRIDILVNNARVIEDASIIKMDEEQWNQVIKVNLSGVFNCTKSVLPYMLENKYGKIVNVASVGGILELTGQTNYVATKSSITSITQTWGRELAPHGIRVNAIAPGLIDANMLLKIPEETLEKVTKDIPVGRAGTPKDVAHLALFLCSDESSFIVGQTISIDGGADLNNFTMN